MASAWDSSVGIVAYLILFSGVGFVFVFVNLLLGRFVRPQNPQPEKQEIYECGEPTIGSSFVQFDLRFYVVALVFIIFDVEVAFLFPWATVFGKVSGLLDQRVALVQSDGDSWQLTPTAAGAYRELGDAQATRSCRRLRSPSGADPARRLAGRIGHPAVGRPAAAGLGGSDRGELLFRRVAGGLRLRVEDGGAGLGPRRAKPGSSGGPRWIQHAVAATAIGAVRLDGVA